jgi:hypothetical protein
LLRPPAAGDNSVMHTEPPKAEPPKRKRRWSQFSLRTLLVALTGFCVVGGWFGARIERAREQRAAIDDLRTVVGWTAYEYQVGEDGQLVNNATLSTPPLLLRALGADFFSDVTSAAANNDRGAAILPRFDRLRFARLELFVTDAGLERIKAMNLLEQLDLSSSKVTDFGLRYVADLKSVKRLVLPPAVTDAGMNHLARLSSLEVLLIFGNSVTDVGLEHLTELHQLHTLNVGGNRVSGHELARLTPLRVLYLGYTPIDDNDLDELHSLDRLQRLELRPGAYGGIHFTKNGVASLRKALPTCEINDPWN